MLSGVGFIIETLAYLLTCLVQRGLRVGGHLLLELVAAVAQSLGELADDLGVVSVELLQSVDLVDAGAVVVSDVVGFVPHSFAEERRIH